MTNNSTIPIIIRIVVTTPPDIQSTPGGHFTRLTRGIISIVVCEYGKT
jgi:hypothetical protein